MAPGRRLNVAPRSAAVGRGGTAPAIHRYADPPVSEAVEDPLPEEPTIADGGPGAPEDSDPSASADGGEPTPTVTGTARPIPPPPGYGTSAAGIAPGTRRPRAAAAPAHIVDVEIVRIDGAEVEVRLADGRAGVIDRRDFTAPPSVGETVPAAVLSRDDDRRGRVALSHRWARTELAWQGVEQALANHTPLSGRVVKEVKGGVVVDVGLRAFLPTSLIGDIEIAVPGDAVPGDAVPDDAVPDDAAPDRAASESAPEPESIPEPEPEPVTVRVADPSALVGREVEVLVTEADRAKDRVVVSRRDLQRRQRRQEEKERFSSLQPGKRVSGRVVSVADYGAVVDLGGVRGLIHRSELSWGRIGEPSDVVSVADEVTAVVLDVNRSKKRIGLSLRRATPDPYEGIEVGAILPVVVTRVVEYGAFARLESGAEGLIHMSELSDVPGYRPDQLVVPGEDLMVKVLDVDRGRHRIALSVRRVLVDD